AIYIWEVAAGDLVVEPAPEQADGVQIAGDVGSGVGVRVKPRGGNDLFGLARTPPEQRVGCAAGILEVLELNVVEYAADHGDGARGSGGGIRPTIDDELAIHPEFRAVVGVNVEIVRLGKFRLHLSRPTDRERVCA